MGLAQLIVVTPFTDADVIRASLQDPERFSDLFRRHFPTIHRFALRRLEGAVADDVAAEVFVRAFARRSDYDLSYESARPWLLAIANDLIGRHRRSERRRLAAYARLDAGPSLADDDAAIARVDAAAKMPAVARALGRLKPAERDLLLLLAWGELSYQDAARALEVPVGTVRSRLARAREKLEAHVREDAPR